MPRSHAPTPVYAFTLTDVGAALDSQSVMKTLMRSGFPQSDKTRRLLADIFPLGSRLIQPQATAHLYLTDSLGSETLQQLPTPLQRATHVLFSVATAGGAIDDEIIRLQAEGDLVASMILDAFALTALTRATTDLVSEVGLWARERDFGTSRAFSPGAAGDAWDLSKQALLFEYVPTESIGVQLTPSYLMRPLKSLSFVLGLGKHVPHVVDPFSCDGCPRSDCAYRHEAADEMIVSAWDGSG